MSSEPVFGFHGYRFRMDKMEAQIANLAAWVQTAVVSTNSSRASSVRSGASTTPSDHTGSQIASTPGSKSLVTEVRGQYIATTMSERSCEGQRSICSDNVKEVVWRSELIFQNSLIYHLLFCPLYILYNVINIFL